MALDYSGFVEKRIISERENRVTKEKDKNSDSSSVLQPAEFTLCDTGLFSVSDGVSVALY